MNKVHSWDSDVKIRAETVGTLLVIKGHCFKTFELLIVVREKGIITPKHFSENGSNTCRDNQKKK